MGKCSCIRVMEEKLKARALGNIKKERIHEVRYARFKNKSYILSSPQGLSINIPFEVRYTPKRADGMASKNDKHEVFDVLPRFCPFCGVNLKAEET